MIPAHNSSPCGRLRRLVSAALLLVGALGTLGVVGSAPLPALAAPGALDPTFGTAGLFFAPTAPQFTLHGYASALQRDGRIVVAGELVPLTDNNSNLTVWRLTPDGALDPTFNGDGRQTLLLPGQQGGYAVAMDPLRRIVVAGYYSVGAEDRLLMVRLARNGEFDSSFNGTGYLTADFGPGTGAYAYGVAIQRDGKIVVAGETWSTGESDFALARFNPDGAPDLTFGGGDGLVNTDFGRDGEDYATAVAIQADGKIVLAGIAASEGYSDFGLARCLPDGTLDPAFGTGGLQLTDFGARAYSTALSIQADGKIVAAGAAHIGGQYDFALARYRKNGSPDLSFGSAGKLTTDFGLGKTDSANALALQANGSLVVAGSAQVGPSAAETSFALARYRKNGTLDPKFGTSGLLVSPVGNACNEANAVSIGKDGRIIAAGQAGPTMAVARYLAR